MSVFIRRFLALKTTQSTLQYRFDIHPSHTHTHTHSYSAYMCSTSLYTAGGELVLTHVQKNGLTCSPPV